MSFAWQSLPGSLRFREDTYSWQGASETDARFFLRRDKQNPEVVTDFFFGNLSDEKIIPLLVAFLEATGGLSGPKLMFTAISSESDQRDKTVAVFDRLKGVVFAALKRMEAAPNNAFLDPNRGKWNAVFELG
ncbi:hypothetical protein GI582_26050 [Sulfitobacter sp. BDSS02]|nr:hypothetical protein [Sulfitobacter sp. BDSS02]